MSHVVTCNTIHSIGIRSALVPNDEHQNYYIDFISILLCHIVVDVVGEPSDFSPIITLSLKNDGNGLKLKLY